MDADPEASVMGGSESVEPEQEKALAVELFNWVWTLLDQPDLSLAQSDEVVHCAHASAWHWSRIGTMQNRAISEWQVSRVYAVLGRPEPALHHARRALELAEQAGSVPWLTASALEGMARAHAVAGDHVAAGEWRDRAVAALDAIDAPEDRLVVENDIASLPRPD